MTNPADRAAGCDTRSANGVRYFRLRERATAEVCVGDNVAPPVCYQLHDQTEIRVITNGLAQLHVGCARFLLERGSLAFVQPEQLHSVHAMDDSGFSYLALRIDSAIVDFVNTSMTSDAIRSAESVGSVDAETLHEVSGAQRALADGCAVDGLQPAQGRAIRALSQLRAKGDSGSMGESSAPPPIRVALKYLRTHFDREISLDDLAVSCGLSKYYFLRLFTATQSVTPRRYQLLLRVAHAKRLLRSGLDIAAVALEAGFADQSHLTRRFHEVVGTTPSRYQLEFADRTRA